MKILFFDSETSGFPVYSEKVNGQTVRVASDDPRQPYLVQLAASVVDTDTRQVIATMNRLVKPVGFKLSDFNITTQGFTEERLMVEGADVRDVLDEFLELQKQAEMAVAFNDRFDRKIIRIALIRNYGREAANAWYENLPFACCMNLATPIMQMPPTKNMKALKDDGSPNYKPPKLIEAYVYFNGAEPASAHDAADDVASTISVWFSCIDKGAVPTVRKFEGMEDNRPVGSVAA